MSSQHRSRLATRRLRWSLAIAAAVAFGGTPSDALAFHWFYDGNGQVIHQHTRTYTTINEINESPAWRAEANQARVEWHGDTILDFPLTTTHAGSRIALIDQDFGRTGWSGLATDNGGNFVTDGAGHYTSNHGHVLLNLAYRFDLGSYGRRGVACQEIGHEVGILHGSYDCMNYTYLRGAVNTLEAQTIADVNWFYPTFGH